jgi:hypothetical protein
MSENDKAATLKIEHKHRNSDGAERHFKFTYLRFTPLTFFIHTTQLTEIIFNFIQPKLITANVYFFFSK